MSSIFRGSQQLGCVTYIFRCFQQLQINLQIPAETFSSAEMLALPCLSLGNFLKVSPLSGNISLRNTFYVTFMNQELCMHVMGFTEYSYIGCHIKPMKFKVDSVGYC